MTASAKFADILLPSPSLFENDDLPWVWDFGNYLIMNNKVIEPVFGSMFEYEWAKGIARNLGLYEEWSDGKESSEEWVEFLYNETRKLEPELPPFEEFRAAGSYRYKNNVNAIAFEPQIKDFANNPFKTPSGKIEIFSKTLYDMNDPEITGVPQYIACREGVSDKLMEKYPYQLIGYHSKKRCHSVHDNNMWLQDIDPQKLWINPKDAEAGGFAEDDLVEVFNGRGKIYVPLHVTDRIMEGVLAISQGAWFKPGKDGIDRNGSINVLTSQEPTPLARGNAQHTNLVDIRKISEEVFNG
jgi:anaerobic dimethyl sulfoxide reductase subunit A